MRIGSRPMVAKSQRELLATRHADQAAVGPEAPGVVGAAQLAPAVAASFRDRRAAMRADVQESAQRAVVAAHDHDRALADRGGHVVAGRAQLGKIGDVHPAAREDALHLDREYLRRRERARRQQPSRRRSR